MAGGASPGLAARNLSHSLGRLKESTAAYGRNRMHGAQASVRGEVRRRMAVLIAACAVACSCLFGILFAGIAVIVAFRDSQPALAGACVAAFFFVLAGAAAWWMRHEHRRRPQRTAWLTGAIALLLRMRRLRH